MNHNHENYRHIRLINRQYGDGKFWECEVNGNTYSVSYGTLAVGKRIAHQAKNYDSHEKAVNEMDKKVRDKIKGGYVEEQ
jgi:predicted DNA-binding WGR domain protein